MKTVNEQLNLPLVDGGAVVYQPSQYGKGTEYERGYNYPVLASTLGAPVYSNSTGWSGCNSCGSFSNAVGTFEFCIGKCQYLHPSNKSKRDACTDKCKEKYNIDSVSDYITHDIETDVSHLIPTELGGTLTIPTGRGGSGTGGSGTGGSGTGGSGTGGSGQINQTKKSTGMSTGAKIGIAVGAVAVIGAIVYFGFIRKKK